MLKPLELGAMFPFLPEGREAVQRYGVDLAELVKGRSSEPARKRGRRRVISSLEGEQIADLSTGGSENDLLEEILSYLYARILVSAVNDPYLTKKFCLWEAKLFEARLKRLNNEDRGPGPGDRELSPGVRRVLEHLQITFEEVDGGRIGLHFTDYLKLASFIGDKNWYLVEQDVERGIVRLPRERHFESLKKRIGFR